MATCHIVKGPNEFALSIALFRGRREVDDVTFVLEQDGKRVGIGCSIDSVATTQDRRMWTIKGSIRFDQRDVLYEATYFSHDRSGVLILPTLGEWAEVGLF